MLLTKLGHVRLTCRHYRKRSSLSLSVFLLLTFPSILSRFERVKRCATRACGSRTNPPDAPVRSYSNAGRDWKPGSIDGPFSLHFFFFFFALPFITPVHIANLVGSSGSPAIYFACFNWAYTGLFLAGREDQGPAPTYTARRFPHISSQAGTDTTRTHLFPAAWYVCVHSPVCITSKRSNVWGEETAAFRICGCHALGRLRMDGRTDTRARHKGMEGKRGAIQL